MIWTLRRDNTVGTPLLVQWLRFHTPKAGGAGLIPGRESKIQKLRFGGWQKNKKKKEHSGFQEGKIIFSWALTAGQLLEMVEGRSGDENFRVEGRGGESTEGESSRSHAWLRVSRRMVWKGVGAR